MTAEDPIPTIEFSRAKATLSDLMDQVFHDHRGLLVSRHRGKERMVVLRPEDVVELLGAERLDIRLHGDRAPIAAEVVELGIVVEGESEAQAVDALVACIRPHAARAASQLGELIAAGRVHEAAALLRFGLTEPDDQADLVRADIAASRPAAKRRLALSGAWAGTGQSVADVPEADLLEGFGS